MVAQPPSVNMPNIASLFVMIPCPFVVSRFLIDELPIGDSSEQRGTLSKCLTLSAGVHVPTSTAASMTSLTLRNVLLAGTFLASSWPAHAQNVPPPVDQPPATAKVPPTATDDATDEEDIVVVGQRPRGSVVGDIPPENTLTGRDVRATGATNITELLDAIAPQIGSARGRGGERPILLLNGQRISGFRELRDIPTEAIQRVEILPEEVTLNMATVPIKGW